VLQADGYEVIVQQQDFANKNFLNEMHEALASGARVVGLLSAEYLTNKNCRAEWVNALYGDPLNESGRLILLRVAECVPTGLLSGIAYWDLFPIRDNRALVADVVRRAVKEGGRRELTPIAGQYWRAPRTIVDADAVRETASFTGRKAELDAVDAALWNGRGAAAIHGLGGMGKSVLAREYARRNADRYSLVWRLQAQSENGVIEGLLRLGARFNPELEKAQDRRTAAFEVTTAVLNGFDKPVLLIFDNLEDEALLTTWRPHAHAHLLATSRNSAWGGDIAEIALDSWPVPDAVSYLRRESGRSDATLTESEAQKIADALGSLPLALSHAAAYLKRTKTVTASSYLSRIEHHLATVPQGAEYVHAVFATFSEAIAKAEEEAPGACALLCLSSFFAPDSVPEELFHQDMNLAADLSPVLHAVHVIDLRTAIADSAGLDEALGALDRLSLVAFVPETRTFTVHRLVQAAARTLLFSSETHWVKAAVAAVNKAFPTVEYETWPICARLLPHALAVLAFSSEDVPDAHAARLANQCAVYLQTRAEYDAAESFLRRALAFAETMLGSEHPSVATSLSNLAGNLRHQNRFSEVEALYNRAIEIDTKFYGQDHPEVATDIGNLALFFMDIEQFDKAAPLLERALAIDEAEYGPKHPTVGVDLSNLSNLMASIGNPAEAERLCRRALAIADEANGPNHPDVALRLNNLALYLLESNKTSEAEETMYRSLAVTEVTCGRDHPMVAAVLRNLAAVLISTDRHAEAEQPLRRALTIDEAAYGNQNPMLIDDLEQLAMVLDIEGNSQAAAFYQRALALRESAGGHGGRSGKRNC